MADRGIDVDPRLLHLGQGWRGNPGGQVTPGTRVTWSLPLHMDGLIQEICGAGLLRSILSRALHGERIVEVQVRQQLRIIRHLFIALLDVGPPRPVHRVRAHVGAVRVQGEVVAHLEHGYEIHHEQHQEDDPAGNVIGQLFANPRLGPRVILTGPLPVHLFPQVVLIQVIIPPRRLPRAIPGLLPTLRILPGLVRLVQLDDSD
mmetsp:Transcript_39838/g.104307  ORF Transcript_39838/g.104307 Transcript_39838/m.104307 type:complete len:203 (-) Transcript_39838:791-1399(-)